MKGYAGKVLIIVQNLPVPFDRRVWLEAKTLRDQGLKVSVICPTSKEFPLKYERIDGISVYRYKMPVEAEGVMSYFFEFAYAWLATAMLSLKVLLREGFDVIQACNPPDTYWVLGWLYRPLGKTFLFDHHDLSPEMFDAKYNGKASFLRRILEWLEKMTLRSARLVLSTNVSYKKVAITRGGVHPENVYVVRTGPDLQRLQLLPVENELKFGKEYMVCYLGEMCPQDGVDILLEAIDHFVRHLNRKDTHFVLVGGGPAMPSLRNLCKKMGLEDVVTFTGRVSDADLCRYLSSADVCVDPDPWSEWANHSTMNKILEYMTFGKPIVAFDLEEHKNSAGTAAVYVKPNDSAGFANAVSTLLDDESSRKKMGDVGYKRIRNELSWRHTRKALVKAYASLFPNMTQNVEKMPKVLEQLLEQAQTETYDILLPVKDAHTFVMKPGCCNDIVAIAEHILADRPTNPEYIE